MSSITIEITVDSLADAVAAQQCGADRIELCHALHTDGLTPTPAMLRDMRRAIGVPLVVMIRPREGDYCYTPADIATMCEQIQVAVAQGTDELIFGCVTDDRRIDVPACRKLLDACAGRPAVFHRVFDLLADPVNALNTLVDLGFRRVLTAGQSSSAVTEAGMETLAQLIRHAGRRIEILPGGGVRPLNVGLLIQRTSCRQVHSSCRERGSFSAALVGELRAACDRVV